MGWTVETLNEVVDSELAALPEDMRARFVRISELIEAVGLPNVREPHVKHVRDAIWEIRLKGKAGIARALYVTTGWPTHRGRSRVHQEDAADAEP